MSWMEAEASDQLPRIFIGGTGRSGTSLLMDLLGAHKDVYSFPAEMRFIVDPDGLLDLIEALTRRYSDVLARVAYERFDHLMRVALAHPKSASYPGWNLPKWLGAANYWKQLDHFCSQLPILEFSRDGRKPPGPDEKLKVIRYFPNRQEIMSQAANFVDAIFLPPVQAKGKTTWCEKTPNNVFHVPALWELFPNSVFLHIKRDLRGVVHSYTKQSWAPRDVAGSALYLKEYLARWLDVKRTMPQDDARYLEIKLEDLAADTKDTLDRIFKACRLAPERLRRIPKVAEKKVNYWKTAMTKEEQEIVASTLREEFEAMGYPL